VPVATLGSLDNLLDRAHLLERIIFTAASAFAGLVLLISALGLYAHFTQLVTNARHEIGVRMALGATTKTIISQFCRHAARLLVVGLTFGILLSLPITHIFAALLFGVHRADPLTLAASLTALTLAGAAALLAPALRIAAYQPAQALHT
jgi:ABC-type antimicrobial peptide transport system permease subunit